LIYKIKQLSTITNEFIIKKQLYNETIICDIPKEHLYSSEMSIENLLNEQMISISELDGCKLTYIIEDIENEFSQYEKNVFELEQLYIRLEVEDKFYYGLHILNGII